MKMYKIWKLEYISTEENDLLTDSTETSGVGEYEKQIEDIWSE